MSDDHKAPKAFATIKAPKPNDVGLRLVGRDTTPKPLPPDKGLGAQRDTLIGRDPDLPDLPDDPL